MSQAGLNRHGQWPDPVVATIATIGGCVGLGNLWRLPALVAEHGGLVFIGAYVLALLGLALPIAIAEAFVGGQRGAGAPRSFRETALANGGWRLWGWLGWPGLIAAFLLLVLLSITSAWSLAYLARIGTGELLVAGSMDAGPLLNGFALDPERVMFWVTLFLVVVCVVVSHGIRRGLAPAVLVLVPVCLIALAYLLSELIDPAAPHRALAPLIRMDWAAFDADAAHLAFRQAFATLALGLGVMVGFGAGAPAGTRFFPALSIVLLVDLVTGAAALVLIGLLAGSSVSQPGLVFEILPGLLSGLEHGQRLAALFYGVITLTLLTSAFLLAHGLTVALCEGLNLQRPSAALLVTTAVWAAAAALVVLNASAERFQVVDAGRIMVWVEQTVTWFIPILIGLSALSALLLAGWVAGPAAVARWLGWPAHGRRSAVLAFFMAWLTPALLIAALAFTIADLFTGGLSASMHR